MKKNKILFVISMVMFAFSFSHLHATSLKTDELDHQDYKGAEIAFVKESKLYFYYPDNKEIKQLIEESEPVFNCVFDNTTELIYYTVERDSMLWLKKAFYQDNKPVQITEICNLKIKKEECITETYMEKAPLIFNRAECIVLPYHFNWNSYNFSKMLIYSTTKGDDTVEYTDFVYKEISDFRKFERDIPHKVTNRNLIYKGKNLSKDLALTAANEDIEGIEFIDFKFSKDSSKLIFGTLIAMGDYPHGPYCVADIDGNHQQILTFDNLGSEHKPFWAGNQVVFIQNKSAMSENDMPVKQLCITDAADNSISVIENNVDYFTVRELIK